MSKVHPQLMLMMLAVCGFVSKVRPADAHDAGCLVDLCPKYAQLMLMMLAVWAFCVIRAVGGFCVRSTPS